MGPGYGPLRLSVQENAVRAGARFATPAWEIGTRAATGLLMLWFAVQLVLRMGRA